MVFSPSYSCCCFFWIVARKSYEWGKIEAYNEGLEAGRKNIEDLETTFDQKYITLNKRWQEEFEKLDETHRQYVLEHGGE